MSINYTQQIKEHAHALGFDACGVCKAESIDSDNVQYLKDWLSKSYHGRMDYMANHQDKRSNPQLLVEGAKSIICLALNYYPHTKQPSHHPQFAYYTYGKDYHDVMKAKLQQLFDFLKTLILNVGGRAFCDTAPVMERYWAAKSGIGFIGKNSLLIIPKKGSYCFLGELIVDIELEYGKPLDISCGRCTHCLDACPTKAIVAPKVINANRCISFQTIENKGDIESDIIPLLNNRMYGCDICQDVCPWNKYARPHNEAAFNPSEAFLALSTERLEDMSVEEYQFIFKGSAVKRGKYSGLKRNLEALKKHQK